MNLIFLYGPPAVGKLTVAKKLTKLTGYKLLDNHLVLNVVWTVFAAGTPVAKHLGNEIRLLFFQKAAQENINIVTTYAAAGKKFFDYYSKIADTVTKNNGTVCFVQLMASESELLRRVKHDTRKKQGKIHTKEFLQKRISENPDLFDKYPGVDHLTIDNTNLLPEEAAHEIIKYYKLVSANTL